MKYEKGKHYDAIIEDDIIEEETRAQKAYREMLERAKALKPTPIFTNITEGGKDMKALYHVILFNKETEKVDYKGYVPAEDALDAGMLAAQDGKYNNKVHLTIIKKIDNSEYAPPIVTG